MLNEKVQNVVDNLEIIKQLYDKSLYLTVMDNIGTVVGFSIPDGEVP